MRAVALAGTLVLVVATACSAGVNNIPCQPEPVTYNLDFPSLAATVGATNVQIIAFDNTGGANPCDQLLIDVKTSTTLPTPLVQSAVFPLCDALTGAADTALSGVTFGDRSLLAITQSTQSGSLKTYFVGCSQVSLTAPSSCADASTTPPVDITLGAVNNTVSVPTTTCTTVSAHCANSC